MPINTSSTGGYLQPAASPAPLEGRALLRFIQGIIVGITGLAGNLVRPYHQTEPPDVPDEGEAWAAFRVTRRPSDEYPFVGRLSYLPETGNDNLQRHEELDILTTFYDTGSVGLDSAQDQLADYNCTLLRDGLLIPQNREPLFLLGMGLVKTGEAVTVPVILKKRWQYRVDLEWTIRRQIDRTYPVGVIVSASGTLYTDTGLPPQPFSAT
jgi:hypothetical protein